MSIEEIINHCKRHTDEVEKLNSKTLLEMGDMDSPAIKRYWEHRQVANYLEEIQAYRAIGTVEEIKALKEADMRGANRAVDEFANYLHRIAKENNGLRLSSETRSWTHPCIFDYLEEFKNDQICKLET